MTLIPESRTDILLNAILVVTGLLILIGIIFVFSGLVPGKAYTEFYIVNETGNSGPIADGYPTELEVGQSASLVVGIRNFEQKPKRYTVVVVLQRIESEAGELNVVESVELDRFETSRVAHSEAWNRSHEFTPSLTGKQLRLQYLLYPGETPEQASTESAYRDIRMWINVTTEEES